MTVRNGKHQLVGMVELGEFYTDMKRIDTGMAMTMNDMN
jgi:hypothetical protein